MGSANSKRSPTGRPFVVDPVQNKNLDMLSAVAARLLSLPDIYDLNNIRKPGTCGDYAVFLKETMTQNLLPFMADIDLGDGKGVRPVPVLYQSAKRLIKDDKVREKICGSITDVMLRTVAIVIACLSSMQVVSQSRVMAVRAIDYTDAATPDTKPQQHGGAAPDVFSWLQKNNYIEPTSNIIEGSKMDLRVTGSTTSRTLKMQLVYNDSSYGTINTTAYAEDKTHPMPAGGIRIQFLDPINVPTYSGQQISMLPMRIVDSTGIPWAAGVLHGGAFQSFYNATPQGYLAPLLEMLLRRTQGWQVVLPETRAVIVSANEVFTQLKKTPDPAIISLAISNYLQQVGYASPLRPPSIYGGPQYIRPPSAGYPAMHAAYGRSHAGIIGPPTSVPQVPDESGTVIMESIKRFKAALEKPTMLSNTPALVRAMTLSASVDMATRDVQTNICADPYWKLSAGLSDITPWESLQFLCVKDWNTLGRTKTAAMFVSDWEEFLGGLTEIYDGKESPAFVRPADAVGLGQLKFQGLPAACKGGRSPRVAPREIETGLATIQGLYNAHIVKMWGILNNLISIVMDPQKRVEAVRLHPTITNGNAASVKFVNTQATAARKAIKEFYLALERTYIDTIKAMQIVG